MALNQYVVGYVIYQQLQWKSPVYDRTISFSPNKNLTKVTVDADLNAWYKHWANINAEMILSNGSRFPIGNYTLQAWWPGENKNQHITLTTKPFGSAYVKGVRVWSNLEGITKNIKVNVTELR